MNNKLFNIYKINKIEGNNFIKNNIKLLKKNKILKLSSREIAWNELFASILYRYFNVNTVKYDFVQIRSKVGLESNYLDNYIELSKKKKISKKILNELAKGFFVDVLLLNYDIMNDVCENIGIYKGKLIRQDVGGSLLFRALGSKRTNIELKEEYSHRSILGKKINKGIFKGYCRDDIFRKMLVEEKKVGYKNIKESYEKIKNMTNIKLDILKNNIIKIIKKSNISNKNKEIGIRILNRIIKIVKNRLKIYKNKNYKKYLQDIINE